MKNASRRQLRPLLAVLVLLCHSLCLQAQPAKTGPGGFAAQGRIEGALPTVRMAFTLPGSVQEVFVKPGARVAKGDPLMALSCEDRAANVLVADADLADARAQLSRLKKGARPEERQVASALVAQAEANVQSAKNVFTRFDGLRAKGGVGGNISELQVEQARDALRTAEASSQVAQSQAALVNAAARREDILVAEARVANAQGRLAYAKAESEKCVLRAPADLTVLKTLLERGDAVSVTPLQVAVTVAQLGKMKVRAEVDERFIERLKLGQSVNIVSDFNPGLKMAGKLVSREAQMGRRAILGTDPADKNDRDVLEVVVEIDKKDEQAAGLLPVGYRVIVQF